MWWLLFALVVAAIPSKQTTAACRELARQYPHNIVWDPLGSSSLDNSFSNVSLYRTTNSDYWNAGSSRNRAACAFYPANARHVSDAVKVLKKYPSVKYALKSGGHNSNLGFSSVDQGIIISFRPNLAATTITPDGQFANVGPGSRWQEAVSASYEAVGKTPVSGRLGHVGVGGFMLGGGLSFLTAQYGFSCDNVEEYEVVLADGTITTASADKNPDLFWALSGGGNQFAIVTNFKMKLYSIGQVWGGHRVYAGKDYKQLVAATTNFTTFNTDPKGAVIVTFSSAILTLVDVVVVFFFYDGPNPPADVFAGFDSVKPISSKVATQTYPELLVSNNAYSLEGFRYQIREATYPNLPARLNNEFLEWHYKTVKKYSFGQSLIKQDVQVVSWAVQPLPAALQRVSTAKGQNVLNLDPSNGDKYFMEYDLSWISGLYDSVNPLSLKKIVDDIDGHHRSVYRGQKPTKHTSGDLDRTSYNPIFMNDGMYDQKVLESYGAENYARLKAISAKRDPEGFFTKRQQGFSFTA